MVLLALEKYPWSENQSENDIIFGGESRESEDWLPRDAEHYRSLLRRWLDVSH